jgi:quinol monooxygenase YgiN
MRMKGIMVLGVPLIASCLLLAIRRGLSEPLDDRMVRIAELEIYPDQLNTYKAALKEEIDASIRTEPGVLTLYAVSIKGHPEQIRLFETYRNAASYQAHLQSSPLQEIQRADTANGEVAQAS